MSIEISSLLPAVIVFAVLFGGSILVTASLFNREQRSHSNGTMCAAVFGVVTSIILFITTCILTGSFLVRTYCSNDSIIIPPTNQPVKVFYKDGKMQWQWETTKCEKGESHADTPNTAVASS